MYILKQFVNIGLLILVKNSLDTAPYIRYTYVNYPNGVRVRVYNIFNQL